MISTSEDERYEDVGYEEPPRKKRKRSPKLDPEEKLEDTIKESVNSFVKQRYQDTSVHV